MPESERIIAIRGDKIDSLDAFLREFGEAVNGPGGYFGAGLDAFDDCLYGGFGIEAPFRIRWENSAASRRALDHAETARQIAAWIPGCHPSNHGDMMLRIAAARREEGPTVFDYIVEIIRDHKDRGIILELL